MARVTLEELRRGQAASAREVNEALTGWQDGIAQWWRFQVGHLQFILRFTKPNHKGNLHLIAEDCRFICGPTYWHNADVQVEHVETDDGYFVIRDSKAEFKVTCNYVIVAHDVEPVYEASI